MALSKIINKLQAGKSIVTSFGSVSFNDQGEANVELEVANKLCELNGFSMVRDNTEAEPTEEPIIKSNDDYNTEELENETELKDIDESDDIGITEEELNKLTAAQLKKIAVDNGINVKNLTRRDQFIAAIMNA